MPNLPSTNFFPVNSETYSSTLASSIGANAPTVPVISASPYIDGDIVVLTVEPGGTGKQATFTGIKSGSSFINCVWTEGNVGASHAGGASVIDYDSATHFGLVSKGMRVQHNQDGTHSAVTATSLNVSGTVTGITPAKYQNPYKFRAYRNASLTSVNSVDTKIIFDTENFDTGNNYDTTNGRFTAPIAGFYQFSARYDVSTNISNIQLWKNGSIVSRGTDQRQGVGVMGHVVTDMLQLAANDYIEVYYFINGTNSMTTGSQTMFFSGFLISAT